MERNGAMAYNSPLTMKLSALVAPHWKVLVEETKGYSPGFFFQCPKKCGEKSNPSESKRKEKLNALVSVA